MIKRTLSLSALPLVTIFSACGQGPVLNSLVSEAPERIDIRIANTEQCPTGGVELTTYLDSNLNQSREDDETTLVSQVVCSGRDGQNGIDGTDGTDGHDGVNGTDGTNGTNGQDGMNGQNGADGADGTDGIDGQNGTNGQNGADGSDGYSIVMKKEPFAKSCAYGGETLFFALDTNRNGTLDEKDLQQQSIELCQPAPSTPPNPTHSCEAWIRTSSDWETGYVVDVYVTHFGDPLNHWTVSFDLPAKQKIEEIWNASPSASSGTIAASSMPYNGKVSDGGTLTFGMKVLRSSPKAQLSSASIRLNGVLCTN